MIKQGNTSSTKKCIQERAGQGRQARQARQARTKEQKNKEQQQQQQQRLTLSHLKSLGFCHNTVTDQTKKYIFNKEIHTGQGRAGQARQARQSRPQEQKNKRTAAAAAAAAAVNYFPTSGVSGFLSHNNTVIDQTKKCIFNKEIHTEQGRVGK
jgi:hypothetical protein